MDFKIWEKTILAWINSVKSGTSICKVNELDALILSDIIKKFKFDSPNPIDFLKATFPNLLVSDLLSLSLSSDCVWAATCLLIYVSYSKGSDLEELREKMCLTLDNFTQQKIAEFLTNIGNYNDVFQLSLSTIKKEISDFIKMYDSPNTLIGDCISTPIKSNISNGSFDSPLQGFFQTPKRSLEKKHNKGKSIMCGDNDHLKHIKLITDQLVEEELEKISLQEQLAATTQKCHELETKVKDKIEEIAHLKYEWESESKKNEGNINALKDKIKKQFEDHKKLKSEISHFETYASSLESDLADSVSEKVKLEHELEASLNKYSACEIELKEISELNKQLQEVLNSKERELMQLRENFENSREGKITDISLVEGSFDSSTLVPESMEVVVEKLLKEKIEENSSLKETIEELREGKSNLLLEIEKVNNELKIRNSTISELQFLNRELSTKLEEFESTGKELLNAQNELVDANKEINKLIKENTELSGRHDVLNSKVVEQEKALAQCKNFKMVCHLDFLKLAQDFNSVQKRLQIEVNNIIKLATDKEEKKSVANETKERNDILEIRETLAEQTYNITNMPEPKIIINSNQIISTNDDKLQKIDNVWNYFEYHDLDWSEPKISLQKACLQLNDSIVILKLKIMDLENNQKNALEEKSLLEKCLKTAEQKIVELQNSHLLEVSKLKVELDEKGKKISELKNLVLKLKENDIDLSLGKNVTNEMSNLKKRNEFGFIHEGGDFTKINSSQLKEPSREITLTIETLSPRFEKDVLQDSLEEVPVCSKTFDIVNVEEKNIGDKTFSIKKETLDVVNKGNKNGASWSISPPSKIPSKNIVKNERRRHIGDSWVVSLSPIKGKQEKHAISYISNELKGVESSSNVTKSSSMSSLLEINSSPVSKAESKSSGATSFFSVTDLLGSLNKKFDDELGTDLRKAYSSELYLRDLRSENSLRQVFQLVNRQDDPLGEIFRGDMLEYDRNKKLEWEKKFSQMRKEIVELSKECERLRSSLIESEQKRKKEKETYEKNQETTAQNITSKYEMQLEHLKTEMKQLYNRELAKHKNEQSKLNSELREQNKRYKEHIDQLRNQLWDLGEKLLQEQKLKRDLERIYNESKKKFENMLNLPSGEVNHSIESYCQQKGRVTLPRQLPPNATFPTIPTEDEDEVFDNRFLEDMKKGVYPTENPEGRLMELQNRNTLCLPHLKSSYPAETQFHNPSLFKENDLKLGLLQFGQESQSLTDSDHSMTRSLLPENKGKKKEQTSYKKPGPPTPSKHGGRLSIQSGDVRMTPRNALREINDQNERNRGTPSRLKSLLSVKTTKRESIGGRDENTVPVTPRKKLGKIFRKPFGARDH